MIYFIFLASLASATCYLVFHWRNRTEFRLRKQLVNLSTCPLTMLLCLLLPLSTSNLSTCLLVDLSTYPVTLSFIYPVYKQLVHLSTHPLVYFSTKKLLYLAFSIIFAIFANCLIHMYHMFVEIIDILYYEFKLQSLCMEGSRRVLFVLLYDRESVSQSDLIRSD